LPLKLAAQRTDSPPERPAEFVYGRLQDNPEGNSRHEDWRAGER
jgi:hypothetical protein